MKIYCEKCAKDISGEVCKNIENYTVGRVICPWCHYEQKRYISQADLLLYLGCIEVFYILISLGMVQIYRFFGISYASMLLLLGLIVSSFFFSKILASNIYDKAWFKKESRNRVFNEDAEVIARSFNWQFILFFAITITYITLDEAKLFFGLAMPVAAALTFIKLYLQLKNENDTNK